MCKLEAEQANLVRTPSFIFSFLLLFAIEALAQTNVSGYILSNTTWTLAGSPYIVTGNALVINGVTLTIEPGVVVKFDSTKALQVDGELIANGTAQNRITFTSTQAVPAPGGWGRIQFSDISVDAVFDAQGRYQSGSVFRYCDILYAGGIANSAAVYCDTSAPYFSHCNVLRSATAGIYFINSIGRVDSSSIKYCAGAGLYFYNPPTADLIVKNDSIEYNGGGVISSSSTAVFSNASIHNNVFSSNGGPGNISAINIRANSCTISDNIFLSNTGGAIKGNYGAIAITDNVFMSNASGTIFLDAGTPSTTNLTVTNNHFENNIGVIYAYSSYSSIQGNTFFANQYYPLYGGIWGGNDDYILINIRSSGGQGVFMNNTVDSNYTAATLNNFYLIWIYNTRFEIAHNVRLSKNRWRLLNTFPLK